MEQYRVSIRDKVTIIERPDALFKMSVEKDRKIAPDTNTALLKATLYIEDGVFVKTAATYLRRLIKTANH
jgi:hypothetical protein